MSDLVKMQDIAEEKPHSHCSVKTVFFFNFKILHLKTQYDRKHLYTPAVFLV